MCSPPTRSHYMDRSPCPPSASIAFARYARTSINGSGACKPRQALINSRISAAAAWLLTLGPRPVRAVTAGESPQEAELAIEQHPRLRAVDLPAPCICQIECTADLTGTAMC